MEMISGARPLFKQRLEMKFVTVGIMTAGSFLLSRCMLLDGTFPVGIALVAAFLSRSARYFYLLPVSLLGVLSCAGQDYLIWGDLAAIVVCGLFFRSTGKVGFALWHKSVIAAAVCMIANNCYYIAAHMAYRLSAETLWLEALVTAILCLCFNIFAELMEKKKRRFSMEAGLAAVMALFVLALLGTGGSLLVAPASMAAILYLGYTMGAVGGLAAGFAGGLAMLLGNGGTAEITVFMIGGLTAGALRGQSRIVTGLCFTALSLAPGLLDLGVSLALPFYCPLFAMMLFWLIPGKTIRRSAVWLNRFLQTEQHVELQKRAAAAHYLLEQKKNFDQLAALYADPGNRRAVMSYQFKGMSQMAAKIARGLEFPLKRHPCKYRTQQAASKYARGWDVSGDSYVCQELEDGRLVMVISDGMGTGRTAASESSLVVSTIAGLLNVGIETELILKILNSILLLNREAEVLSTVDMGILDRHTGQMRFYKIGAAPTLIKRQNTVEIVKMEAMPMGIVDGLDVDYVSVSLKPGDQVIMMSDGVMDSKREDLSMEWLVQAVQEINSRDPQTMCDLIINQAVRNYGTREKDDLTVLAVRMN